MSIETTATLTPVKARCHCGANQFTVLLQTSSLPLSTDLCHCTSCRHTTGMLAVHTAPMQGVPRSVEQGKEREPADLSKLSKYNVSPHLTRYFCSNCGAYMLYETVGSKNWSVSTGCMERTEGIVEVGYHAFVGDTLDGGMANQYRVQKGVQIPRYKEDQGSTTLPLDWKADKTPSSSNNDEGLPAYCHCRSISLLLKRPPISKPEDWWVVPGKATSDPTRFMTGYCVCRDCSLTSGSTLNPWLFSMRSGIIDTHTGQPIVLGSNTEGRPNNLRHYKSSELGRREFCGRCGATIFFSRADRQDGELIDVAPGLIDHEVGGGARAEAWCFWYHKTSHEKEGLDSVVIATLNDGIQS